MSDVWPELLHDVKDGIQCELVSPSLASLGPGAIWRRVVEAGDSRCGAIDDDFRKIDGRSAAVCARDCQTAEPVFAALPETAAAQREVPRILLESSRESEFGEEITHGLVGKDVETQFTCDMACSRQLSTNG